MQIFIKQNTGRTITLEVEPDTKVAEVAIRAYEKRSDYQQEATLENYARSITLIFAARSLCYDKKLSDYNIQEESTIHEIPRAFTMSPNFSFKTLSMNDPISLRPIKIPFLLNPGCQHTFETENLRNNVLQKMRKNKQPTCPCCKKDIFMSHVSRLLLFSPPSNPNNIEEINAQFEPTLLNH